MRRIRLRRTAPPRSEGHTVASSKPPRRRRLTLTVRVLPGGKPITLVGREAQTLKLLIECGGRGFTCGEASPFGWARRTPAYIHDLRRKGIPIASSLENTPDGARVARYRLVVTVEVIVEEEL